jgi:hypothetical protein
MHSTLISKPSDDPHDVVVVAPDAVKVAPSDEELSDLLQQAARMRADTPTRAASDIPAGAIVPPVDTTFRPASVGDAPVPGNRSSMARRALRGFMALLLAACIGVAAFVWRAYGDTAEKKIAKWATQLVLTVSSPPENPGPAAQPAPPAARADAASPQPALQAESAANAVAPAAAAPSADSAQLLQSMARELASLGQEVELLKASLAELKAGQQQVSRDVAKSSEVRASEQNLRPRKPAPPPRLAAAPARRPIPSSPPPQSLAAPALPPAPAPYVPRQADYAPRQAEPPPPTAGEALTDPELSSVPRPPMPLR